MQFVRHRPLPVHPKQRQDRSRRPPTLSRSSRLLSSFSVLSPSSFLLNFVRSLLQYPRAVYLVDLSKSASTAVVQYASTIEALFDKDIWPGATAGSLDASKSSGGWLSKILGGTSRKDGFMIPVKVCSRPVDSWSL